MYKKETFKKYLNESLNLCPKIPQKKAKSYKTLSQITTL